eukprot:TRINITY_DN76_c0_g2_i2.p1 TRINITY_DN76_c0_g2~~TRINITY_DN76_c0_g2_i2.p1  ORF type:complete len:232 (+),score=69.15 TRINITY_DN76_c0_g2_i2:75-698(+)
MGGQESKMCCGDGDADKSASIQSAEGSGMAGTEELMESKKIEAVPALEKSEKKAETKQAVLQYKEGATYTGEVLNDKRSGHGVFKSNNETYDGQWLEDKQHGFGKHTWSDGRTYEGEYANGKFCGKGKMEWNTDKGKMLYEGDYLDDVKHGQGKFTWQNGNVYDGGWQNGKRHGKATFLTSQGKKKVGRWSQDKFLCWEDQEPAPAS